MTAHTIIVAITAILLFCFFFFALADFVTVGAGFTSSFVSTFLTRWTGRTGSCSAVLNLGCSNSFTTSSVIVCIRFDVFSLRPFIITFETWLGTFLFITIGSGQLSFPSLEIDSVGTQPVSTLYKVADMPYTSVHVPCHSAEEYCSGAEYPGYISQAISVPVVLPALIWKSISLSSFFSVTSMVCGLIPLWIIPAECTRLSVVSIGGKSSFTLSQLSSPEQFAR